MGETVLQQFAPFASSVDNGFWWKLSQKKLDVYKLDDTPTEIHGYYSNGGPPNISGLLNVDYTAFDEPWQVRPYSSASLGTLIAHNTIEDFKECNKKTLIDFTANKIWEAIVSGSGLSNPELINRFLLMTYVDLKKYHFYYWFAFPALCYPKNTEVLQPPTPFDAYFSSCQKASFLTSYEGFARSKPGSYFLLHCLDDEVHVHNLTEFQLLLKEPGKVILGFCDPSTLEGHPGWPLRNFLALVHYHWGIQLSVIDVLCFRDRVKDGVRTVSHGIVLHLRLQPSKVTEDELPNCVGWELNERQKKGPRKVDLGSTMNSERMAETSVDLNLKLMRWRLVPSLDLDTVRNTRCLLLGSGTLGCNVARCLLGWGIQRITLVDNGRVSYSNPVRQSLFNFEDCLDGGKPKAEAAASALRRIYPNIESNAVELSIPMPGHFVLDSDLAQVKTDVSLLEDLIRQHDVVFLLTDTRESRWLPSVLAAHQRKLVVNAALGFDTFLVMRHGVLSAAGAEGDDASNSLSSKKQLFSGTQLGCYFCNDVVAPGDSTRQRTMDQQCTVTRPGISMIAAAMAVELMVSVLQHPHRGMAPAETNSADDDFASSSTTPLGIVPHQIRGFLSLFYHILPVALRFDKCTACSPKVIEQFELHGFSFLLKVFNNPTYLEDLSGLTQLHSETLEEEVWELSDDDNFKSSGCSD